MMKQIFSIVFVIFLVGVVSALYIEDKNTLDAGHAIRVKNVAMVPENLVPGEEGLIAIEIENGGNLFIDNMQVKLGLPSVVSFYKDVDKIKISRIDPGESKNISFRIIASPAAKEGLYEGSLDIDYITHFGTSLINVGDNQKDNYTLGIIIRSTPALFMQLQNSEIYRGNSLGEIGVKLVNKGLSDIQFLSIELEESPDYDIIDESVKYIGDLDSDDFDTANFRINVKSSKREIILPIKIEYKDSLNKAYETQENLVLQMRSAQEMGVASNVFLYVVLSIIFILGVGYFLYRRYKKKQR